MLPYSPSGEIKISEAEVIPAAEGLSERTYNVLICHWLDNFARNIDKIRSGLDLAELPKQTNIPCICVGAGPSLHKNKHLQKIKKANWKGIILTCDRELYNCLKHGLTPYAVASVDGSERIANYYVKAVKYRNAKKINAIFSITVHPNVVNVWKGKIYWFTSLFDIPVDPTKGEINNRSPTFILHVLSGYKSIASGIGNVGSFCWNMSYILECNPVILVGYDFSEQVKYKEQAVYFDSFVKMFMSQGDSKKKAMDKAAALHQVEYNPDFNNYYLINPVWKQYREQLAKHIVTSGKMTINCTEGGCLHTKAIKCKNFKAMTLDEALDIYGDT